MSLGDKSLARSCVMWGDIMGASNYDKGVIGGHSRKEIFLC